MSPFAGADVQGTMGSQPWLPTAPELRLGAQSQFGGHLRPRLGAQSRFGPPAVAMMAMISIQRKFFLIVGLRRASVLGIIFCDRRLLFM